MSENEVEISVQECADFYGVSHEYIMAIVTVFSEIEDADDFYDETVDEHPLALQAERQLEGFFTELDNINMDVNMRRSLGEDIVSIVNYKRRGYGYREILV